MSNKRSEQKAERDAEIFHAVQNGRSYREIGLKYNITGARVAQIFWRIRDELCTEPIAEDKENGKVNEKVEDVSNGVGN